jgi:transcription-repair coupling factor (superfamily II helicase)
VTALAFLVERFAGLAEVRALAARPPAAGARIAVGALPGSAPAVLVAALARALPQRLFVVVAPTPADAERWLADLTTLAEGRVALFPQREALGMEEPHYEIAGERIETLAALLSGGVRILVTTARASAERTGVPRALGAARIELAPGPLPPGLGGVTERLEAMGYARVPSVRDVAQYSVRGGILDVYGFGMAAPVRVEWWGDDVASLRAFDLDTQRSGDALARVTVLPIRAEVGPVDEVAGAAGAPTRASLLELLPDDALLIADRQRAVSEEVERAWADAAHHLEPPSRAPGG